MRSLESAPSLGNPDSRTGCGSSARPGLWGIGGQPPARPGRL